MKIRSKHRLSKLLFTAALAIICGCGSHDDGRDELKHHHEHAHHHDEEDHKHGEEAHHHDEEAHDHNEDAHGHGEGTEKNGNNEIVLHPAQAEKFGVEVDTVKPGQFNEVIRTTGQIVDNPSSLSVVSAPSAGIVKFAAGMEAGRQVSAGTTVATITASAISGGDRNAADKANLQAAKRELDRITPLYKEGIVSAKDYNAALQAYEQAQTQYSPAAASGAAKAVAAGSISQLLVANGQYVEAGTPIATIGDNRQLTLRADVPDKYINEIPLIQSARMVVPSTGQTFDLADLGGKRISGNPSSRVSPGYIPVFFTFKAAGNALPSTLADVYLIGAVRSGVISVPKTAVTEQQGHYFVYVKLDEECYEKIPVTLGLSDGERIEVISGLKGGECVVTKGASAVRLAETSSVVPEGHSHSH